jgi:carbon storage regulator
MLVLTRRPDERIIVGPQIQVVVLAVAGRKVRLGIVAPPDMAILRDELRRPTLLTLAEHEQAMRDQSASRFVRQVFAA